MDWMPLERAFEENFSHHDELGAAVAVWCGRDDRPLLQLQEGWMDRQRRRPWTSETLSPVWSATKGPAAWCLLQAMADAGLAASTPVAELWPQLRAARPESGSTAATLGDVLHHRLGLAAIDEVVDGLDHSAVVAALERQPPQWRPGSSQGYHPRTFGWLVDELVRRLSDTASLGEFWEQRLRQPRELEFWIGLPAAEHGRVATMVPGKWTQAHAADPFYASLNRPDSLQARAFRSPDVARRVADIGRPEILAAGLAAFGGVGTAAALARFYAGLAARPPVGPCALPASSQAEDTVLLRPLAFRSGYMVTPDLPAAGGGLFGADRRRFGYPGAGGVLAFADPRRQLGFAYVMNQMELRVLPATKAPRLVRAFDRVTATD